MPIRRVLAAAVVVALSTPVIAADKVLPRVDIEDQATATPPRSETVRGSDARGIASGDTAALLRDLPGVQLNQTGGVSSLPAIHGLADDRVRIRVDGMDFIATCPNHMNPPLSYLDPAQIDTLKVYAGIAPVSVGGDSIAGSIVAETRAPEFAATGETLQGGEVSAYVRSNNRAQGGGVAWHWASENVQIGYTGGAGSADNYRAGGDFKVSRGTGRVGHELPLDVVGSSAYESINHALTFALRRGQHWIEARLGRQDMPEQLFPNQRMDLLENTQKRGLLRYHGDYGWGSLDASAYREVVDHVMDFGRDRRFWYGSNAGAGTPCDPIRFMGNPAGTCAAGMPMASTGRTIGARLAAELDLGNSDLLRVGSDIQRYRLNDWWAPSGGGMGPGTFWNVADGERDRDAVYAEWERQISHTWLTVLGARYEHVGTDAADVRGYSTMVNAPGNQYAEANAFNAREHARRDNNWDLSALMRYSPADTLDLEFGLARKVRTPNLYERYTWSSWSMAAAMNNFVGDGNGYVGNIDLKPEVAYTVSAAIDGRSSDGRWQWHAMPYVTRIDDFVDASAQSGFMVNRFNLLQYTNQSARVHGIDLSGRVALGTGRFGAFAVEGVINHVRGRNRSRDDDLYQLMPLNARLRLKHELAGWDSAVEWELVAAKERVSQVRNEVPTDGYGLLHLRSQRSFGQLRVDVGIDNLFNRRYFLPTGGAYLGQGMSMSLNGVPWGIAVPGIGDSYHVGLALTF